MRRVGGCQCGAVRFRCAAEPVALYVCHCSECRAQSSSAFGISYVTRASDFELLQGATSKWRRMTDSGREMICTFCAVCGTRLHHQTLGREDFLSVKGGTLDEPVDLARATHIWVDSRLPGVVIPPGVRSFGGEPH